MKLIIFLLSMPKTIYFNLKVFPLRIALKLPVLVAYNVKITNIHKNCIQINSDITSFMIRINFGKGSEGVNTTYKQNGYFDVREKGKLIFNGKASFSTGISIRVDKGILSVGNNFSCNKNCFLACSEGITIGDDVLLGWSVNIRDSDGHSIINLDNRITEDEENIVVIKDHVWIAANVDILKGVRIPTNCVVGYNSCITNKFFEENCIIAGYPAKVVKTNINWVH